MPTTINIDDNFAVEESTAKITVNFTDEANEPAVPSSITYTLTDINGTVVNNIEDKIFAIPASEIVIVLQGDDLQLLAGETGNAVYRILTIEALYSSDIGSDLPLKDSLKFPLKNLVAVT